MRSLQSKESLSMWLPAIFQILLPWQRRGNNWQKLSKTQAPRFEPNCRQGAAQAIKMRVSRQKNKGPGKEVLMQRYNTWPHHSTYIYIYLFIACYVIIKYTTWPSKTRRYVRETQDHSMMVTHFWRCVCQGKVTPPEPRALTSACVKHLRRSPRDANILSSVQCSHGAGFKDMMWKPSWKWFVSDSLKPLQASLYLLDTQNGLSPLRLHQHSPKAERISLQTIWLSGLVRLLTHPVIQSSIS